MHCFYSLEQFYRRLDHTWKVGGNPRVLLGYALYSIFAIGSIRPKVTRTLSDRTLPEDLTTLAGYVALAKELFPLLIGSFNLLLKKRYPLGNRNGPTISGW